jgi:hypothetical protein
MQHRLRLGFKVILMAQLGKLGAAALLLLCRSPEEPCSRRRLEHLRGRHATPPLTDLSGALLMMQYDWQWKKRYVQILLNCTANLTRRQIIWRSPSWVRYFAVPQSRQNRE